MNIGILMAGGTGNRMAASLPKQFIELGDRPIIMHSLSKLLESGCFDAIYIGIHPDWADYMKNLLYSARIPKNAPEIPQIHIIRGGDDRNSTLLNVLEAIESDIRDSITSDTAYDGSDNPHVEEFDPIIVTHDAVRPFVTVEMIKESVSEAAIHGAATVAIPTTDTIAQAGLQVGAQIGTEAGASDSPDLGESAPDQPFTSAILDRNLLYNIQTPQSFRLSLFRQAYSSLSNDQIAALTDVCGIFAAAKIPVKIVPGSSENIKITNPLDLELSTLIYHA